MKRTCTVCGKGYDYCPNCQKDRNKPKWMIRFDAEPCKNVWDILIQSGRGEIDAATAIRKIEQQNVTPSDPGIVSHISTLKKSCTPVVETIQAEDDSEPQRKRFGKH